MEKSRACLLNNSLWSEGGTRRKEEEEGEEEKRNVCDRANVTEAREEDVLK